MRYNQENHCVDTPKGLRKLAKTDPAIAEIALECADATIAREIVQWQKHLGAERRLSPKTLEAYARDVRQFLIFLAEHRGKQVTLKNFAGIEASDIRAFMAEPDGEGIDRAHRLAPMVPMKRVGTAEEIANAIVWLISDEASYVTSAILDVSGGR